MQDVTINTHLRPVRAHQSSTKLTTLMDEVKTAQSPDQKESLDHTLKTEIKMLKEDPTLLADVRQTSPQLDAKIAIVLEGEKLRGR